MRIMKVCLTCEAVFTTQLASGRNYCRDPKCTPYRLQQSDNKRAHRIARWVWHTRLRNYGNLKTCERANGGE